MSTHLVEVVPVKLEAHPNADTLSVVRVRNWTVVVRTADWRGRETGAYIPPDYVVPTDRPEFAFLEGGHIRVLKLRGIRSEGLLIPAPEGTKIGDNVMERLGVKRWTAPEPLETQIHAERGPDHSIPVYDVESYGAYGHLLVPGEQVVATEKINGENGRFVFVGGRFFRGSRNIWMQAGDSNPFGMCAAQNPWIEEWCRANPGVVLYGEVCGGGKWPYGTSGGQRRLLVFDAYSLTAMDWVDATLPKMVMQTRAPEVFRGPFDPATIQQLASGNTTVDACPGGKLSSHIREGVVVRPVVPRSDPAIGRVMLKIINDDYYAKSKR